MIHFRYGPPKTRREQGSMEVIAPAYGAALRSGLPSLIAQLDAELAERDADPDSEPELPGPRPGGILSWGGEVREGRWGGEEDGAEEGGGLGVQEWDVAFDRSPRSSRRRSIARS